MSRHLQDRWVAAGAAAVPFIVGVYALRLVNLPHAVRLPLGLLVTVAILLFGIGLYSLLCRRGVTLTLQLAVLAMGGYTLFLLVDVLVYAAIRRVEMGQLEPGRSELVLPALGAWIVMLDILKGFTNSLAKFLFSINLLGYSRFGTVLGAAGIAIALVTLGHKIVTFPAHPPFPFGVIAGPLWVVGVAVLMARSLQQPARFNDD